MKNKIISILKVFTLVLLVGGLITGCTKEQVSPEADMGNVVEDGEQEEMVVDVGGKDHDILVRSEDISDLVVSLYGIDNATAIILNDLVAIGLEIADDGKLNDDIREMVTEAVLKSDSRVRQVLITDNEKIFSQIENIVLSLMDEKPYDEHIKEINRIIEKMKR